MGIYKRNKKVRKHAFDRESDHEKRKKTRSRPRKRSRKNDNGQEKEKENMFPTKKKKRKTFFLFFLLVFFYKFSPLTTEGCSFFRGFPADFPRKIRRVDFRWDCQLFLRFGII